MRKFLKAVYASVPFKRQTFSAVRAIVPLPVNFTQHLHFQGPFRVRIDKSHVFYLNHWGFSVENDIFWNGFARHWEATSLRLWKCLVPHSSVIVDVGANTGVYALAAKSLNPHAVVFALEPVPRVYDRLVRNIQLNGYDVRPFQVAASDSDGICAMYETPSDHLYSASLDASMLSGMAGVVSHEVPTRTLSGFFEDNRVTNVHLLKIDVEKHEPQVLNGLGSFLSRCKPSILIEVLDAEIARQINSIIDGLGYLIFRIAEGHGIDRTSAVESAAAQDRNVLLIQPDLAHRSGVLDFQR